MHDATCGCVSCSTLHALHATRLQRVVVLEALNKCRDGASGHAVRRQAQVRSRAVRAVRLQCSAHAGLAEYIVPHDGRTHTHANATGRSRRPWLNASMLPKPIAPCLPAELRACTPASMQHAASCRACPPAHSAMELPEPSCTSCECGHAHRCVRAQVRGGGVRVHVCVRARARMGLVPTRFRRLRLLFVSRPAAIALAPICKQNSNHPLQP